MPGSHFLLNISWWRFYLVLFDVEVIFLYPWAINFKELGIDGMIKMVVFMLLLLVGFFYIIKKKALEWE